MSTELAVYGRIADPIAASKQMGTAIAKSKMFGCDNIEQGEIIAYECIFRRRTPLSLAEEFDIVKGKLRRKAEATLARFRAAGGKCIWLTDADNPREQRARWIYKENDCEIGFTIEQAEAAGLLKDDSNWRKYPADMLQARAITKACKRIAAEILGGSYYAPEEVSTDYVDEGFVATLPESNGHASGDTIDDEFQVVEDDRPATTVINVPAEPCKPHAGCTSQQSARIKELFALLQLTEEQIKKALTKRGANVVRNLTSGAANELIASLESKLAAVADNLGGESQQPTSAVSWPNNGPCSAEQVAAIKREIVNAQDGEMGLAVQNHLHANGKKKIAELTVTDADTLLSCLQQRNIAAFIDKTLAKPEESPASEVPFRDGTIPY